MVCEIVFLSFLYKSIIPYVREIGRSGYGITGAHGKPATLMEGGFDNKELSSSNSTVQTGLLSRIEL